MALAIDRRQDQPIRATQRPAVGRLAVRQLSLAAFRSYARLRLAVDPRPVVLTAVAAILGVLPIAFGMNIEFAAREITIGAPATQWWIQLSTAIVFGLSFATILTLVVTPAQLALVAKLSGFFNRLRRRGKAVPAGGGAPEYARKTDGS